MPLIDTRGPISFGNINRILLKIAESPLQYTILAENPIKSLYNREAIVAAQLAREASASIISNCVINVWSETVSCLNAMEPGFPFYPSNVSRFVTETRLPFMSYLSLFYSLCGQKFEGTAISAKIKIMVDVRHELQHDKPEGHFDYSSERIDKALRLRKRFEAFIKPADLDWQPRVRHESITSSLTIQGEPPVMKLMKYPVATWAVRVAEEATSEMSSMLLNFKGPKKFWPDNPVPLIPDERFLNNPSVLRFWSAGE